MAPLPFLCPRAARNLTDCAHPERSRYERRRRTRARRDRAAVVALIKRGADVNAAQPDGATALHWAAHWNEVALADDLLRAGAKPNGANEPWGADTAVGAAPEIRPRWSAMTSTVPGSGSVLIVTSNCSALMTPTCEVSPAAGLPPPATARSVVPSSQSTEFSRSTNESTVVAPATYRWSLPKSTLTGALVVGMTFTLVGLLLLSIAWSYALLLVAAALVGVGSSVFHPESSRIARLASGGSHGLAQSLFQVGGNFGSALGPLAATVFAMRNIPSAISAAAVGLPHWSATIRR